MSVRVVLWALKLRVPVSHACSRVLMVLAEHAGDDGRNAYPSLDTIADIAQADRRTVMKSLAKLEADRIITRQKGGGRTRTTVYDLNLDLESGSGNRGLTPPKGPGETGAILQEQGPHAPVVPAETGAALRETGADLLENRGLTPPEPVLNLSRTKQEGSLRSPARARPDPDFETWWQAYPRKVGKDDARKAFAAAVKRGALPLELVEAVRRQAWDERPRYRPHPATWLNQGRWQDDPEAAAPRQAEPAESPAQRRIRERDERMTRLTYGDEPPIVDADFWSQPVGVLQ